MRHPFDRMNEEERLAAFSVMVQIPRTSYSPVGNVRAG